MIAFSSGTPIQSVTGGLGGTTNSTLVSNFPYNGATGGASGIDNVTAPFFDIIVQDDTLCGGGSTTLVATVVGSIPGGADVQWYDAPNGGNIVHTGSSFTTPPLTVNTTYYVGVCPGTFREEVTVFVSPLIEIDGPPVVSDETCAGNDGAISGLIVSGGAGVLTYEWNGQASASPDLTGVIGGSYTLVVTDENGCTASEGPITVNASPGPSIDTVNLVVNPESCIGNDGAITGITATGTGLTFEWNGQVSATTDLIGIAGGNYTLVVTDDQGCISTLGPINVPSVAGPVIDTTNLVITDESCAGNDGAISGIVVSGSGLDFTWNGTPSGTLDLVGITAGSYTLEVTDQNGCTSVAGPFIVQQVGGPLIDDAAEIITDDLCGQGVGSIEGILVTGDLATWEWNGNAATGADLINITAGTYTLVVTDINGCSSTAGPYVVQDIPGPEIDTANMVIQDESCVENDGSITGINVTGNNVVYAWNNQVATSPDLSNLTAGNYTLNVADENGCVASAGPFTINFVPGPTIDDAQLAVTDVSCEGMDGAISGLIATGNNLSFEWNGENANLDLVGVGAGNYTLTVTDENGCTSTYGPINIQQAQPGSVESFAVPSTIFVGDNSQINTNFAGGGNVQSIVWSPDNDLSCNDCLEPLANPSETTIYTITITDEFNCVVSDTVIINVLSPCETVFVPTIFSPNGDGKNDFFCVLDDCLASGTIQVFNRWGELVFETSDITQCWDGTHKGVNVNSGVFVYQIEGGLVTGENIVVSGNVTVIR
ncbi:MAG: gliding motility-associated C-terminal domain-containing protein [Crocinitomicaceae bacterium]|nr:gliding motility-associated C-terminal domain-containing protein [Crocinitomicaceae bacterium]